jgi:hypothetical protein
MAAGTEASGGRSPVPFRGQCLNSERPSNLLQIEAATVASAAELTPRTFCTFPREVLVIQAAKAAHGQPPRSQARFCASTRATCGPRFSQLRLQTHGRAARVVGTAVSTLWSRGSVH